MRYRSTLYQYRRKPGFAEKTFVAQCQLARELQLPLIVHSRDAFDQTLDVLKDFTDLVVYFHCR